MNSKTNFRYEQVCMGGKEKRLKPFNMSICASNLNVNDKVVFNWLNTSLNRFNRL